MPGSGKKFELSLVTPDGAAYEGEVEMVIVPGEHADLAGGAGHDDHLRLTLEGGTVRRHQRDGEAPAVGHLYAEAIDLARSTAPSIGPTM